MRLQKILLMGLLLLLLPSLASCAKDSVVRRNSAVQCEHPEVDPRTKAGLYDGLRAYWKAVETCNAMNGYGSEGQGENAAPVASQEAGPKN